jgi:hypothetical protein
VKPQYVPGVAAGGGTDALHEIAAEHVYVVFVDETVTLVDACAVPSTVVMDVNRPVTLPVQKVCCGSIEKVPSGPIA